MSIRYQLHVYSFDCNCDENGYDEYYIDADTPYDALEQCAIEKQRLNDEDVDNETVSFNVDVCGVDRERNIEYTYNEIWAMANLVNDTKVNRSAWNEMINYRREPVMTFKFNLNRDRYFERWLRDRGHTIILETVDKPELNGYDNSYVYEMFRERYLDEMRY